MHFDLKRPCKLCPYRKNCPPEWLGKERAQDLAQNVILGDSSFACHNTVNYQRWEDQEGEDGDAGDYVHDGTEQFCAGALLMEKKCNEGGNLSIRLARMFLGFKYELLKGADLVFDSVAEFITHHSKTVK